MVSKNQKNTLVYYKTPQSSKNSHNKLNFGHRQMFHTSFFLSHSILAEYIQIKCKIFQTWCPKTKKTHLFTIKHPRVLKIAITSLILATDKCFTPHFSCLTLNLLEISESCAKYFRQGVQKLKKHTFYYKTPQSSKNSSKKLNFGHRQMFHISFFLSHTKLA